MVDNLAILISHILMLIALWRVMQLPDDAAPDASAENPLPGPKHPGASNRPARKPADRHA